MKIVIVGAGTAGIATAIELVNNGFKGENITMIDKGHMIDKRKCFVDANTSCKKCKTCSITNGVGGSGSFSDSKLNFDVSGHVGGDLYELWTREEIEGYLRRTYDIYRQFNIEEFQSKIYGLEHNLEAIGILNKIKESPNMEMLDVVTCHLGTDNSRIIYKRMVDYLLDNGVKILSNTELLEMKEDGDKYILTTKHKGLEGHLEANKVVLALGRSGGSFIRKICKDNNIKMKNGRIQYGLRIETLNEYMKPLNDNFYEAKIYLKGRFEDSTRVFCANVGGVVSIESYPYLNDYVYLANGHSYADKERKTNNTNFALLVSRGFNEDCPNPTDNYLYPLLKATNSLGKGSVILQSLRDIRLNRRSTEERIKELDIVPSAKAYAGDLLSVIPYRLMVDILEAIEELDKICPGLNGNNTLLYGMEAKFSSNKVLINKYGETSVEGIYCIGDCSSWTRGLTSAFSQGIRCAEDLLNKQSK